MSSLQSGILIAKLSFNLHPRLVSLSWLKRRGVRCFCREADNPKFPVRYIPKKGQDVNQTESSTYRDRSHRDGRPTRSDSNIRKQNNTMGKFRTPKSAGRLSFDAERELNQESGYGKGGTYAKRMRPLEEVVEELQIGDRSGQGRQHKWGREINFRNKGLHSKDVKEPQKVVQETQIGVSRSGQDRQHKWDREINFSNEVLHHEDVKQPEKFVQETQIGVSRSGQDRQHKWVREINFSNESLHSEDVKEHEKIVQELQSGNRSGQGRQHKWDQQINFRNEVFHSKDVKEPEEVVQKFEIGNGSGQGPQHKWNREDSISSEVLYSKDVKKPKKLVQEIHIGNGSGQGRQPKWDREINSGNEIAHSEDVKEAEKIVQKLQIGNGSGQGQQHKWDRESNFSSEVLRPEDVKGLEEVVQELRSGYGSGQDLKYKWDNAVLHPEDEKELEEVVQEFQINKGVGRSQQFRNDEEISDHNEVIDADSMDVPDPMDEPEEELQEMEVHDASRHGEQEMIKACRSWTKQDVQNLAVKLLARRAFTAVELQKKLTAKKFPLKIVQEVVHDFLVRGLVNDRLYAETYSMSKWTSSTWGPGRIKQALSRKGVSKVNVEKATKLVFEKEEDGEDDDDGGGGDQRSNLKLSKSCFEKLYVQAAKQWQRSRNVPPEKRKTRIVGWLQYRGFNWGVISIILKKLESQYPP